MFKKWMFIAVFSALVGISCEQPKAGLDQLFPGAGFTKGWSWQGKPKHFLPNNLYEYIDGEAELYLSYNFKELASLTYFWGAPEDTFFTVDIYDMGTSENAFGLYSSYRYPGYQYEKIGTEAFVSDFGLKCLKGQYVIEIKSSDESEKCRQAIRTVVVQIVDRITAPPVFPSVVSFLPESNQVPQTLRYYAKEMLNQAFLPQGVEAKYKLGNEEATGFTILFSDAASAEEGLKKLRTFYQESSGQFLTTALPQPIVFAVKTQYHGITILSVHGNVLNGVQDLSSPEKGFELIRQMATVSIPSAVQQ